MSKARAASTSNAPLNDDALLRTLRSAVTPTEATDTIDIGAQPSSSGTTIKVVAVSLCLVALVPLMLLRRLEAATSRIVLQTDESEYVLPEEQFLVPLSLGYREAASGLVWVQALSYFGRELEIRGRHEDVGRYVMAITTLDPYFYRAYSWGAVTAVYNGGVIDLDSVAP